MKRILIIDDDKELGDLFQAYLQQEQFEVDTAVTGSTGLGLALSGNYELIILDMMLPDMTGTDILLQIRRESLIPVIMFTAKGDEIDRIIGLEAGADDYVPKPCTPRELVARIRAIFRRTESSSSSHQESEVKVGPLTVNSQQRRVLWKDSQLDLTSTEFNLIEILARKAGHVVNKEELSTKGLGRPLVRFDRSIDVHISSIRHKLSQFEGAEAYIKTIRGKGYQLIRD